MLVSMSNQDAATVALSSQTIPKNSQQTKAVIFRRKSIHDNSLRRKNCQKRDVSFRRCNPVVSHLCSVPALSSRCDPAVPALTESHAIYAHEVSPSDATQP